MATISTALNSLHKYHEHWLKYRHISEQLKYHKHKFSYGVMPYTDTSNRLLLLINTVEELILDESRQWIDRNKEDKPQAVDKSGESSNNLEAKSTIGA